MTDRTPPGRDVLAVFVIVLVGASIALGASASIASAQETPDTDWNTFQNDSRNTGHHPEATGPVTNVTENWNFTTGGRVQSSPTVVDNTIYVGSDGGDVYALNATDGSKRWNFSTGGNVKSSPTVVDNTVYVGSNDNSVYALNAADGSERWNFTTGESVISSPAVVNNTVYVGSDDNAVYALNATDGTERWNFSTDDNVETSPAVMNETVYVGSLDNNVYALNATDGSKRWNFSTGDNIESSPTVANNTVYIGSDDNDLYALNATDGSKRWNFSTGSWVRPSPVVVNNTIYIGSWDNQIYALNASTEAMTDTEREYWNFSLGDVMASPVVVDNTIYFGSWDGSIYALNASTEAMTDTEREYWNFTTDPTWAAVDTSPAVVDGTVYVGRNDDNVYALGGSGFPGTLTGTVTDSGGNAISGVTVKAVKTTQGTVANTTTTDQTGAYTLQVSAGTYDVIVTDPNGEYEDAFTVRVSVQSESTVQQTFTMQEAPGDGTIQGTVVNASNTTDTISSATIKALDTTFTNSNSTTTDANGNFTLQVPEGTYRLSTTHTDFAPERRSNVEVTENNTAQVTIALSPPATLNGTVTNASGTVASAFVIIAAQNSNQRFFTQTDQTGDYSQNLPPGNYSATVFKRGEVATAKTVSLASGENKTADLELKKASINHSSVEVVNATGVDTDNISVFADIGPGIMLVQLLNDNTKTGSGMPNDLEPLGVDADTEFIINVTATNYTANSLQWGASNVSWNTTDNATVANGTDITVRTKALNLQGINDQNLPIGPLMQQSPDDITWPSGADDRADLGWNRTVYFGLFDLATAPPQLRQNLQGVTVTTNGQTFSPPEVDDESLEVWVAGPSTTVEGESHDGFYRAFIPDAQLDEWGVDDPTQELNTLYKGDSANFTVDETDDGPNGRAGAWIELQNISYSAGEVNITANPQTDTTDDSGGGDGGDGGGGDGGDGGDGSGDGGGGGGGGGGSNGRRSSSAATPEIIEDPEEIEEVIEDLPADVQPRRAEQAAITVDEATSQVRVTFTEESTTESITFETEEGEETVEGEVTVAEYDSEPEETGPSPGRSVSVTQITVPDPDRSATIRKRVSTDRLEEINADAEDLRINRFNNEAGEWQALETEAVERTDERVVIEAETPGFSFFSVSAVSDPDAVIAAPSEVDVGETFTLDGSDSSDEYGEIVSYEWVVAGETLTGETVTTTIDTAGEITIELTVENDAGETTTETATIVIGDGDDPDDEETEPAGETNDTDAEAEADGDVESEDLDGFGVLVALIALLAAALVARQRA